MSGHQDVYLAGLGETLRAGMMGPLSQPIAMKLPEGWKVWLGVIALNAMAAWMWFVNRGVERPEAGGSLWAVIRSLGSGGVG